MDNTIKAYRTKINELLARLEKTKDERDLLLQIQKSHAEPIAVVGMACRFPAGGTSPEAFWRALEGGVDGVHRIPPERWPAEAIAGNKPATRWAALLDNVDGFDAEFFGIAAREANHLDPQQRLLLEMAWEALENAGERPDQLIGSRTGVFVGMCTVDYQQIVEQGESFDVYSTTGNVSSTAAGRISYVLGLQGPCLSVDTACSSSLTAVHLACQSLRHGESNLALAGGVKLMLSPHYVAAVATLDALSSEGRCKTFDAGANGFVLGEGCGIVVLKRLSDAERDGNPILALIRGTAINQDGRSTGLTAPNVLSQQSLLREALEIARVRAEDIGYVETHGTGTSLGDPVELEALKAVLGKPREDGSACVLGAVKTNIGHLEAAAGVAGLIKTVLCLQHDAIPKNLHFRTITPQVSLAGTSLVVPAETRPWGAGIKRRIAGVSSFGFSGTNAHVIVEEAPRLEERTIQDASSYPLPLSAKTPEALSALARSYQQWFTHHGRDVPLHDISYTASERRTHLENHLCVVGRNKQEIAKALEEFAAGEAPPSVVMGKASSSPHKIVFVFPGQGSQWVGMGRQLLREEPAFRSAMTAVNEAIRKEAGSCVFDELNKPEETSRIGDIDVVQPVLFAIEVALAALWRSWGIEPTAVVGHSMGEVAAAFVAGALSLGDAAAIIVRRSRLLRRVSGGGAMALVELTMRDASLALVGYENRLSVAVSNGPRSTVIAGDPSALEEVLGQFERNEIFCRRVKVDVASHSPQMDPLRDELVSTLRNISPTEMRIAMRSTVTGEHVRGYELSAAYWADNLRQPVLFSTVVKQWIDDGATIFLEMSPHPILITSVEENLRDANADGVAIASMRRTQDERQTMLSSLGALFTRGVAVDWKRIFPAGGRVVDLPAYPWQRQRYWVERSAGDRTMNGTRNRNGATRRASLLGPSYSVSALPKTRFWDVALTASDPFPLGERILHGRMGVPWALALQAIIEAASQMRADAWEIEDVTFTGEPTLDERGRIELQVHLTTMPDGWTFSLASSTDPADDSHGDVWRSHVEGRIRMRTLEPASGRGAMDPVDSIQSRCREIPAETFYATLARRGLSYGTALRVVQRVWARRNEALGVLSIPANGGWSEDANACLWAFLDGAVQILHAALPPDIAAGSSLRVAGFRQALAFGACPPSNIWAHAHIEPREPLRASLVLFDESGRLVYEIADIRLEMVLPDGNQPNLDDPATIGRILRDICGQVMGSGGVAIDVDAPLNTAGIDSLMAMQILRKAEQALGVGISAKAIGRSRIALQTLTLRALTDVLVVLRRDSLEAAANQSALPADGSDEEDASVIEVEKIEREDDVPATYRALIGEEVPIETFFAKLSSGETIEVLCAGAGAPLVLLPPIMASIPIWVFQIRAFWHNYRVIIPNYPGYGRSLKASHSLSPTRLARRIAAVLDGFGIHEPVHVVGWSLGGFTGQEFALTMPDRLRSLTLVNTAPCLEEEDNMQSMENLLGRLIQDLNQVVAEPSADRALALTMSQREATFAQSTAYMIEVLRFDVRERIRNIRTPTLVVQGLLDTCTAPRYGRFMNQQIVGAHYHEVEEGGHFVPLHLPQEFNELLHGFLASCTRETGNAHPSLPSSSEINE